MVRLNDAQEKTLGVLRKAWEARTKDIEALRKRQAEELAKMQESLENAVIDAVAEGLHQNIPQRQMALAMGTKVYSNRQSIHDAALLRVPEEQVPVLLETPQPGPGGRKEVSLSIEDVLTNPEATAKWIPTLKFEFVEALPNGYDEFRVTDGLGLLNVLHANNLGIWYTGDYRALEPRLLDHNDEIMERLKEAKNV